MRRFVSIAFAVSPFAMYASARLLSAIKLDGSMARTALATLITVSAGAFCSVSAFNRQRRDIDEFGYAWMPSCASLIATSGGGARGAGARGGGGPGPGGAARE